MFRGMRRDVKLPLVAIRVVVGMTVLFSSPNLKYHEEVELGELRGFD
jgi:hypothetical protein